MPDSKPNIAVPLPTSRDFEYNDRCWKQYAYALAASGATAIKVPLDLSPSGIRAICSEVSGVLLPGSPADVDPRRYGQDPIEASAPPDPSREETDILLLEQATAEGKPILGICYGVQILNVWHGGTLIQDLPPVPVNHSAGASVAVAHTVELTHGASLQGILASGGSGGVPVNSSHHQAVGMPGTGLVTAAVATQDGVIEAVEPAQASGAAQPAFLLGVQWHPERDFDTSAESRALFGAFVQAALLWRASKP